MKHTAIPKRRSKPRRGRVYDPDFMAFCHATFGCQVTYSGGCNGPNTFHHVKAGPGWPKDDTRGLMLCFNHHEAQGLPNSIENLGKRKFETMHGIDVEERIAQNQREYVATGGVLVNTPRTDNAT